MRSPLVAHSTGIQDHRDQPGEEDPDEDPLSQTEPRITEDGDQVERRNRQGRP
jgi:hypothetical protein